MEIMTTGDVAKALNCSSELVRLLAKAGRLPCRTTRSGQRIFLRKDVEALARQREAEKQRKAR